MSRVDFEELKQISAEIKAIQDRSKQDGQQMSKEEQDMLDQLAADREMLLSDMIYHGYDS